MAVDDTDTTYSSPEVRKQRLRLANIMMQQGMSTEPIRSWTQGLGRVAHALMGGYISGAEDRDERLQEVKAAAERTNVPGLRAEGEAPTRAAAALAAPVEGTPAARMAAISAAGETGVPNFSRQANISPDTGGSRSYGAFGVNSGFGRNAGGGSAGQFAATYPSLGLTAVPGSPQFDAQWKAAAANAPDQLQAAQMDWYQKNILPAVSAGLAKAGVPEQIAADPRVQAYFADRSIQQGPASTVNHAARIVQAVNASGGDPAKFIQAMSAGDRGAIPGDFRTYLSTRPQDIPGLQNRIATREQMAMGFAPTTGEPGQRTQVAALSPTIGDTSVAAPVVGPQVAQATPTSRTPVQPLNVQRVAPQFDPAEAADIKRLLQSKDPHNVQKGWDLYKAALTKANQKPEYNFHPNKDGTITATNKNDPNDVRVVDPKTGQSQIDYEARETAAKAGATGLTKGVIEQYDTGHKAAASAANEQIPAIHEARKALDQGAVTGLFAEGRLNLAKGAALFGFDASKVANTEVFRAAVGEQVLGRAKSLGANPSNTDRDYIEKVVGGQISLDEKSMRRLLDMQEKWARQSITQHNTKADALIKGSSGAYDKIAPLMRVEMPGEYKAPEKTTPTAPSAARPAPRPGDVEDGWKFKGGNPKDPRSWEQVI